MDDKSVTLKTMSRLINAKPFQPSNTVQSYPWIAFVQLTASIRPGAAATQVPVQTCGGAIISKNSILSAGHCLCVGRRFSVSNGLVYSCPEPPEDPKRDLNNNHNNRLAVQVGMARLPNFLTPPYDPNIKAYLYNYQEATGLNQVAFSNNGDIGIIILDNDLIFAPHIRHIDLPCIPVPPVPNDFEVETVGWGTLYDERTDPITANRKTSCQTNEGRTTGAIRHALAYDERLEFLDCQVSLPGREFCNTWLLDNNFMTLPISTDLPTVAGIQDSNSMPSQTVLNSLRNSDEQKECDRYLERAKTAWRRHPIHRRHEFDAVVDRIVIRKFQRGPRFDRICYNLVKVAKYGICLTNEQRLPSSPRLSRHWGFCSRSCSTPVSTPVNDLYEHARFTFFETPPVKPFPDIYQGNLQQNHTPLKSKIM